jgi:redox-sensitive bicupin YhaK (pirin superfamily)
MLLFSWASQLKDEFMITVYPYTKLGHANHGWLDARHHFSFARYWNPDRMMFGTLRVINDDKIAAGGGFDMHPHDNMEIITYVREGAITHKDSMGHTGRTGAGDVQVMSAGTGVLHSEFNGENKDTRLFQIWIEPNEQNVRPRWEAREFPKTQITGNELPVLVSGREADLARGALYIHQDAAIYGGRVKAGTEIRQPISGNAYLLASVGNFSANGISLKQGDGAEVVDENILTLKAETDAEILVIDVPMAA